ncbi:unnamed protein product [Arabidopsis halleri]
MFVFFLRGYDRAACALLAFGRFCVQQSAYPETGPLENLATHLAILLSLSTNECKNRNMYLMSFMCIKKHLCNESQICENLYFVLVLDLLV